MIAIHPLKSFSAVVDSRLNPFPGPFCPAGSGTDPYFKPLVAAFFKSLSSSRKAAASSTLTFPRRGILGFRIASSAAG